MLRKCFVCVLLISTILETTCVLSFMEHATHRNKRQSPQGNGERSCALPSPLANGKYSPTRQTCPPNTSSPACKMVPGTLVPQGWQILYSCNAGYFLNTTATVSYCLTGDWYPALPSWCLAGEHCTPLRSLQVNLECKFQDKTVSCNKAMRPGTIVTPTCKTNYKPAYDPGYKHLTCLANGYWDNQLYYCTPDQFCPPLKPVNMNIKCTLRGEYVSCDQQVQSGTIATTKCKNHYKPANGPGSYNITCLSNGNWDQPLYYCIAECGLSSEVGLLRPLVVDGVEARVGAYPWHAGLYGRGEVDGKETWVQMCGGSLITDQIVLTAAHCVVNQQASDLRVALGKFYRSWDIKEPTEKKRGVSKIVYPREYNRQSFVFDMALLFLDEKIETGEFIMPVCHGFLDGISYITNKNLFVVGWGLTERGSASDTLLYNDVSLVSPDVCQRKVSIIFPTFDKFCTNKKGSGSVVQQGDSGGGLTAVYDGLHYIFGIVSIKYKEYSLFTNITWPSNLIWIEEEVRKVQSSFSWIGNEITTFHDRSRICVVPEASASRRFCSLAEGCENCDEYNRTCYIPPGTETDKVRVVCNPGYSLWTPYKGGDVATCLSGGSWYPRIPECLRVAGIKYVPGDPWTKVSWHEARDNCAAKGNELAMVKTRDQQLWFEEAATKQFNEKDIMPGNIWIGLTDTREETKFTWVDESAFRESEEDVAPWLPAEPSNGPLENCVQAVAGSDLKHWPRGKPYQWNNGECSELHYYFCKEVSGNKFIPGNPWKEVTWKVAKENCVKEGYQLAIVKTKEQQKMFEKASDAQFKRTGEQTSSLWIGLSDTNGNEEFIWVDGTVLEETHYSRWMQHNPNNVYGQEHCIAAQPVQESNTTSYRWNDKECKELTYFVCQDKKDGLKYILGDLGVKNSWIKVTWQRARNKCHEKGYQLAVIKNHEQQMFFEKAVTNRLIETGESISAFWIGLSNKKGADRFYWVDGFALKEHLFTSWQPGEPNNVDNREHCVQAVPSIENGNTLYKWNDRTCAYADYYFCQDTTNSSLRYVPGNPQKTVTWQQARYNCIKEGYQLATIKDREQQELFVKTLVDYFRGKGSSLGSVWLGLTDLNSVDKFKWVDGIILGRNSFTKWNPDEPNNIGGTEVCVEMYPEGGYRPQGQGRTGYNWNDNSCHKLRHYFCQRNQYTGYNYVPGNPWKSVSWEEAKDNCHAEGYQLAVIQSEKQQIELEEAASRHFRDTGARTSNLWIGLRRIDDRKFKWVDGSVMGAQVDELTKWLPNEPNNAGTLEHCVQAVVGGGLEPKWPNGKPYQWNDNSCYEKKYYICEETSSDTSGKKYSPGDPWTKVDWFQARVNCRAKGKRLATIKSTQERESFKEFAENHFAYTGAKKGSIWIGLRDDKSYKWVDNSALVYKNFAPNEPNDSVGRDNCIEALLDHKWNDILCSILHYYVCSTKTNATNNSEREFIPGNPWIKVTWEKAREYCNAQGHDLAVITSQQEMDKYKEVTGKKFKDTGIKPYWMWIGLRDEIQLEWVDGTVSGQYDESPWLPGEPSTRDGTERCVEAVVGDDLNTNRWPKGKFYEWNDDKCWNKNYYFCTDNRLQQSKDTATA